MEEKHKLKTLATASPVEALMQLNKIRKKIAEWVTITDIMKLRKQTDIIGSDLTAEEKKAKLNEQARKNVNDILDSVLEKHPQETAEVIALCCFVEVEEMNNHKFSEYLMAFYEMLEDETVIELFSKLVQSANSNGLIASGTLN